VPASSAWHTRNKDHLKVPELPCKPLSNQKIADAEAQTQPSAKQQRQAKGRGDRRKPQQEEAASAAAPAGLVDLLTDSDADEGTDEPKVMPAKAEAKAPTAAETTRTLRSGRATTVPQSLELSLDVRWRCGCACASHVQDASVLLDTCVHASMLQGTGAALRRI
jgi:hypothetical protein